MNRFLIAAAITLTFATGGVALASNMAKSDSMSHQGAMSHNAMKHNTMKHNTMKHDAMKHNAMKHSSMGHGTSK